MRYTSFGDASSHCDVISFFFASNGDGGLGYAYRLLETLDILCMCVCVCVCVCVCTRLPMRGRGEGA